MNGCNTSIDYSHDVGIDIPVMSIVTRMQCVIHSSIVIEANRSL